MTTTDKELSDEDSWEDNDVEDDDWGLSAEEKKEENMEENKFHDLIEEQRRKLIEVMKTKIAIQDINNSPMKRESVSEARLSPENISEDSLVDNEEEKRAFITENNSHQQLLQESTIDVDKILQDYQNLNCSHISDEEMIQEKSTSKKRLIHPNKLFNLSITSVFALFGILCGLIISHFTLYSLSFISLIILISILLIGLGLWFGSTEVIEERVIVTQTRLPITHMLSKRAINLWKSSECQTISEPQENTSLKSYVDNITRDKFADKDDDDDDFFGTDLDDIGLRENQRDHEIDETAFTDDSSEHSIDDNNDTFNLDNTHGNIQSQPKLIFVDVANSKNIFHPRKVKRKNEKDHIIYGPFIPSFTTGSWIYSKSEELEKFEQKWNLSNIILRDDLVGQRNSIVPNIRIKNEEDYRSSKIFTEIEMGNIKNNVNQHREELYNFGVDNTHYEPVIAPPKVRDLCKVRRLVLKFEH